MRTGGASQWLHGKESACHHRRPRFDPCIGMIPWKKYSEILKNTTFSILANIPYTEEHGGCAMAHKVTKSWT